MMKFVFAAQVITYIVLTLVFGHFAETIEIIAVLGINYLTLHLAGYKLINTRKN